jgi:hypothetical protein
MQFIPSLSSDKKNAKGMRDTLAPRRYDTKVNGPGGIQWAERASREMVDRAQKKKMVDLAQKKMVDRAQKKRMASEDDYNRNITNVLYQS